jgi:hypothetical protein
MSTTIRNRRRARANRSCPRLEALEARLAPATLVNATTVTYQDVDGDNVTVHISKPVFSAATINQVLTFDTGTATSGNATPQQLQLIDLSQLASPAAAGGATLSVTAARDPIHGGDGFANIGFINATGIDLGPVTIHGDLGKIDAGTSTPTTTPGLATLTVQSMGRFGTTTQAASPTPDLVSNITGKLSALTVKSDIVGAFINVNGGTLGQIGPVTIGGSLEAVSGVANSGSIQSGGNMGPVTIAGDIVGGDSQFAGSVLSAGGLAQLTVGGSIEGGAGSTSGVVDALNNMGPVRVGVNLMGGAGQASGSIHTFTGKIGSISIGGSVIGGSGPGVDLSGNGTLFWGAGSIASQLDIGLVTVGGSLEGGSGAGSGAIVTVAGKIEGLIPGTTILAGPSIGGSVVGSSGNFSALIYSAGDLGPVVVKGDVRGGTGQSCGEIVSNGGQIAGITVGGSLVGGSGTANDEGAILSFTNLGPVTIGGDVLGGSGQFSGWIAAGGFTNSTTGNLASVKVGGSVIGGTAADSGEVVSLTNMGPARISGDIRGGSQPFTGFLAAGGFASSTMGALTSATVGGSLIGGDGNNSGIIAAHFALGPVVVSGRVQGGSGANSGEIDSQTSTVSSVTVGGSLLGGSNTNTGEILGTTALGPVKIGANVIGGSGQHSGEIDCSNGTVATVTVAGSLVGGDGNDSGEAFSSANMGLVSIGGDVRGGNGTNSGAIHSNNGNLAGVTVKGSLVGAAGNFSGDIDTPSSIGPVSVGGDVLGGTGKTTGTIAGEKNMGAVSIGGSLVGGSTGPGGSGVIATAGNLGPVSIGGNLVGGSISGSATVNVDGSGYILGVQISSITIGGSIIAGSNTNTGTGSTLTHDGSIRAGVIGSITVNGSLIGNRTNPVIIAAAGTGGTGSDVAIGSLKVGGRVELANILAGYGPDTNGLTDGSGPITDAGDGQASIGTVKVGGDWIQSNLVAGATAGADNLFGTADDTEIGTETTEDLIARIASILIGGQVLGTPPSVNSTDHYGFVAEDIGSFAVGGTAFSLKAGPSNDGPLAVGATGDVALFEVP